MAKRISVVNPHSNVKPQIVVNTTEIAEWEADLASALIERWGLVAALPDGEDSGGRQKLRRMSPAELVAEACETASLAIAEFRSRGWTVPVPTYEEAADTLAERENAADAKKRRWL